MSDKEVTGWGRLDDAQLAARIRALGPGVEPTGIDLVAVLRGAIDAVPATVSHERRRRSLAVAAALVLVAGIVVFSVAPARTAVANWLGIGGTRVVIVDELPPAPRPTPPAETSMPRQHGSAPPASPVTDGDRDSETIRIAALGELGLVVRLPNPELVGALVGWEIRATGATRELIVTWEQIALTARTPSSPEVPLEKFVTTPDALSTPVLVDGTPALWIEGLHVRAAGDVVESVGNTLLWESNGIEYRVFGELVQLAAIEIAGSLQ